jgi:hypothetical protein
MNLKNMFKNFGEMAAEILYYSFCVILQVLICAVVFGFMGCVLVLLVGLLANIIGSILWAVVATVLVLAYLSTMILISEKLDTATPAIALTLLIIATTVMAIFMPAGWNIAAPIIMWAFVILIGYASYKKWG